MSVESKLKQTNEKPVLLAGSLVTSQNLTVSLKVAFPSKEVTIYKNTTKGIFSTILEVFDKDMGVCGAYTVLLGARTHLIIFMLIELDFKQNERPNSLLEDYSNIYFQRDQLIFVKPHK